MNRPLSTIGIGETVTITAVDVSSVLMLSKLVAMGIVVGSTLTVVQRGLFGSPINVKLFGSVLSLRECEAEAIHVTNVSQVTAETAFAQAV